MEALRSTLAQIIDNPSVLAATCFIGGFAACYLLHVVKAVSVLVSSEETNEEQPKIIQLGAELKGHNGATFSKTTHVCRVCNVPCVQCVSLHGSSVDERDTHSHGSGFSAANVTRTRSKPAEVLTSSLEMTGLSQNTYLPDFLVTSTSSSKVPPPPPPPLPTKLQAAGAISTFILPKQQNALKKSQDKPAIVQPAITLEALQKVTLRKTNSVKGIDLVAPDIQPETSGYHECGPEDRQTVQHPRKTRKR